MDLVKLNNLLIGDNDWTNGGIYPNGKEFFNTFFNSHQERSDAKRNGNYTASHKWIKFDAMDQIETFPKMFPGLLTQIKGDIPTYIENNFEEFKDLLKL